jgi:hypothetical protein
MLRRYGVTRSTDGLCAMDCFSVIKVQTVDLISQDIFHMIEIKFYIF